MKNYRKIYNEKFKGFFQRCNTLFHLVSTFRKHCWSFVLSNEIKSLGKLNILLEFLCEYFKTWIFRIITKVYHERGLICSRISSLFAPFWAQCFVSEKFMKMGFQYSLVVVFFSLVKVRFQSWRTSAIIPKCAILNSSNSLDSQCSKYSNMDD